MMNLTTSNHFFLLFICKTFKRELKVLIIFLMKMSLYRLIYLSLFVLEFGESYLINIISSVSFSVLPSISYSNSMFNQDPVHSVLISYSVNCSIDQERAHFHFNNTHFHVNCLLVKMNYLNSIFF